MLTDEQIKDFQKLYENRFRKFINEKEAYEKGTKLLQLMKVIYKPMTEAERKILKERLNNKLFKYK